MQCVLVFRTVYPVNFEEKLEKTYKNARTHYVRQSIQKCRIWKPQRGTMTMEHNTQWWSGWIGRRFLATHKTQKTALIHLISLLV